MTHVTTATITFTLPEWKTDPIMDKKEEDCKSRGTRFLAKSGHYHEPHNNVSKETYEVEERKTEMNEH
ncbi:hypothetical protein Y1Q_0003219 [Alligator mississippiensis]|uniref:Uncharacterized protein n=1 Tax=Alligator mississippiensis TaxID=8496 RepID=A0A151MDV6_ALLMI|nr:hypothetical protein Y1Q_0003219 [Alligator mississippiensis]